MSTTRRPVHDEPNTHTKTVSRYHSMKAGVAIPRRRDVVPDRLGSTFALPSPISSVLLFSCKLQYSMSHELSVETREGGPALHPSWRGRPLVTIPDSQWGSAEEHK